MAACPKCDEFLESKCFEKPREYLELARRLLDLIDAGVFELLESTCPVRDLFNDEWPAEMVEHNLQCHTCGRSFQLFADTYRGNAGWGLTGPQTKQPELEQSSSS